MGARVEEQGRALRDGGRWRTFLRPLRLRGVMLEALALRCSRVPDTRHHFDQVRPNSADLAALSAEFARIRPMSGPLRPSFEGFQGLLRPSEGLYARDGRRRSGTHARIVVKQKRTTHWSKDCAGIGGTPLRR